jgi:SOS-response transcriptional repressor LexA
MGRTGILKPKFPKLASHARKQAVRERVLGYRCVQVIQYINEVIERDGIAPSYNMICDELGISSKTIVCRIIQRLEKRGLVQRVVEFRNPRGTSSRNVRAIMLGATSTEQRVCDNRS